MGDVLPLSPVSGYPRNMNTPTPLSALLALHTAVTSASQAARDTTGVDPEVASGVADRILDARPDMNLGNLAPDAAVEAVGLWCSVAYAQRPGPYLIVGNPEDVPTCVVVLPGDGMKLTPHVSTVTLLPELPRAFQPDGSANPT